MPSLLRAFNARALSGPGLSLIGVAGASVIYGGRPLRGVIAAIGDTVPRDTFEGVKMVRLAQFTIPKTVLKTAPLVKHLITYDGVVYEIERISGASETEPAWVLKCSAAVK